MDTWQTKTNPQSPLFKSNYSAMTAILDNYYSELSSRLYQGEERHINRHLKRGKLLPRDRVDFLLDEDTPFLELMVFAGANVGDCRAVVGVGVVSGVECMIIADMPTIKGGAINEVTMKKIGRATEIAILNRLPTIRCVETAGADLTMQAKVFHVGGGGFRSLISSSKQGIPTISIVFGSSTAGGAYTPGMSDYVIMVKNQARVFLAGPPLVKMATGEETDAETLGGAEMHSRISGVSDYLADDEYHAIHIAKQIVTHLHHEKVSSIPDKYFGSIEAPIYDPDEILGIISPDLRNAYDSREVIARLVDGSKFHEWKPEYGKTIVCCWAELHGFPIAILANNGVLFPETSDKAAHFIALSDKRGIPLLFLQNITGFMVGKQYEHNGIIKHGAHLINAVSNAEVPALTVMIGASYGAGNYAMCGRAYGPRFLFSWPNSKVAVMGSDQLVGVMTQVRRDAANSRGIEFDEEDAKVKGQMFKQLVDSQSDAYYVSGEVIDDGIIDPRDTRDILGMCLSVIHNTEISPGGRFGVARL
eukprot:TRINITY_DN7438_c0_g1_i1.p1 TRINITY_DN7438_c0_g1~~TRINITY_DN7438_c0_g1_i1.p1  ORF type:complete len:532 (-),score=121.90 TRINITY_DN7438_c0_g1_i1:22-1617(-)